MNKKILFLLVVLLVIALVISLWLGFTKLKPWFFRPRGGSLATPSGSLENQANQGLVVETVMENLEIPWEIGWLPSGEMLVTERPGILLLITTDKQVIEVQGVSPVGEGGLLGMAIHPQFQTNQFIYLYLTSKENGNLVNRVERYRLVGSQLVERKVIVSGILAAANHDGGRLEFGPDGKLYITTGDASQPALAQDKNSLNGKILRVDEDGSLPEDNPFGNAVYSYGHRNSEGLAWDSQGRLWATEHGPSGLQTGNDELNLIKKGHNYGWPEIVGEETKAGMETPVIESGKTETWAPAGLEIINDRVIFGGLRGETLYTGQIDGEKIKDFKRNFVQQWGRIRVVRQGPDGWLYLATSNRDGRGTVRAGDDRIVRIKGF